jgi:hypothetical protein
LHEPNNRLDAHAYLVGEDSVCVDAQGDEPIEGNRQRPFFVNPDDRMFVAISVTEGSIWPFPPMQDLQRFE